LDVKALIADSSLLGNVLSGNIDDYPDGIIIPIDKPYRWTSADVVRKLKWAACKHFGKKNLKVGHAGTLDPLATGVLLICVGKATRLAETLQKERKEYVAGIAFGATTPSFDLEKAADKTYPIDKVTEESVTELLPRFLGEQDQVAPLFSAKSVDGVRAYELARRQFKERGKAKTEVLEDFDHSVADLLNVQRINIYELDLLSFEANSSEAGAGAPLGPVRVHSRFAAAEYGQGPRCPLPDGDNNGTGAALSLPENDKGPDGRINVADTSGLNLAVATVRIACSKGTYIRALARDFGEALDSGAHLASLRRTKSGGFDVETALSVQQALSLLPVNTRA
jgi:tRNA pseudouridine55 synthase